MRNFFYQIEKEMLTVETCGADKISEVQAFQSTAYKPLTEDRKNNVYFCSNDYRRRLFDKGGEAVRLFDTTQRQVAAQAMLTSCANVFEFIDVIGAAANMIEIQNFPGSFAAISNFLINPDALMKRGLAKRIIEECSRKKQDVNFVGFICVSTNRTILKEALAAGCKIFGVTKDKRLDTPTYLLGISRLHSSCGDVVDITFQDEIVLANFFDMGYAVESIDWVAKSLRLRMQVIGHQTFKQTA